MNFPQQIQKHHLSESTEKYKNFEIYPNYFYEMDNVTFSPIKKKNKFDLIFENEDIVLGTPEYHADFLYFLKDRIVFYKEIDYIRNRILQTSTINLISLFEYIDQLHMGKLDQRCFHLFLLELGLKVNPIEVSFIFKRFCFQDIDTMNPKEFISIFESPNRKFITYNMPNMKGKKSLKDILKYDRILLVRKLFRLLIDSELSAEHIRVKLQEKEADFKELYNLIRPSNKELLDASDFVYYFDRQGYNLRDHEVFLLMQVFDKNHTDKVNWDEFVIELLVWNPHNN